MKNKKQNNCIRIIRLLLVLAGLLLLSGCARETNRDQQSESVKEEKLQIGMSFDSFVIERWLRDRDLFDMTARNYGAEVNVQVANGDAHEQISQIQYFIKKNMDVIVVVAADGELLSDVIKEAKEAGIRVISYDRLVMNADTDLYISFDNEMVGTLMGEAMVKALPEGGNIFAMYGKVAVICAVIMFVTWKLAQHKGIPTSLVWVLIVVLIYGYITSKTTIGRYFYAVGGNEKATKLSGINTNMVYFIAYTNMSFLAALAGMLTIARMTSAQPTYGQNYEMDAISSCFIGGASAYGGVGTVPGVIIGAVLMGIINQGMSIMGTDQNMQKVVKGLVLLAAVIFDVVSKKKSN